MSVVIDAYLKWEKELRQTSDRGALILKEASVSEEIDAVWFSPVLVELHPSGPDQTYANTITAIKGRADINGPGQVLIDTAETELLGLLVAWESQLGSAPGERAVLYRPEASDPAMTGGLFTEIKRGPPVLIRPRPIATPRDLIIPSEKNRTARRSFMGVVDDGLPFLNDAYKDAHGTRIMAIWLQAITNLKHSSTGDLQIGRVLRAAEINDLAGRDEASVYRAINRDLFQPTDLVTVSNALSHGSHILSVAAGSYRNALTQDSTPALSTADQILAVQLEPTTVLDTSARRLNFAVVHAVRWMMTQAIYAALADDYGYIPLVVNLSYGAAAGPKDGSGFLESALRNEIQRYERWTNVMLGQRSPLRVVLPFGNGYRDKLTAVAPAGPAAPVMLNWRLQPDDRTASYLEVRAQAASNPVLHILPPGEINELRIQLDEGEYQDYGVHGDTLARIFREPDEASDRALYVIATRPTRNFQGSERMAPAGAWGIRVG
ncbi:MAG: hypothetical protein AAFR57_07510, partial [Pseudomonadota bacterium]